MQTFPKVRLFLPIEILISSVVLCFLIYAYYSFQTNSRWTTVPTPANPRTYRAETIFNPALDTKLFLFYTAIFGNPGLGGWWLTNSTFDNCPYKCGVTTDRSLKDLSDAIVFHAEDDLDAPLPLPHSAEKPDQVWVFHLLESPVNTNWINFRKFNGHINWTMTYQRHSDVVWAYGRFLPGPPPDEDVIDDPTPESIKNKRLVAAMISNCEATSGRQELIKELEKYIPVDYYGKCGNLTCSRDRNCYQDLGQKYKFWLSFENSLCDDYVTEKFFRPLYYGVVPVVYGAANYSAIAPIKSFINVRDFKGVKDLADHLLHLDQNEKEYLEYLDWRQHFHVPKSSIASNYCNLCTKLHTTNNVTRKSYRNISHWFKQNADGTGPSCTTSRPMKP